MMLFSGSRTFVFSVLNVKNLNAFMYTLCSCVLKLNNRKHLLFMTFLKSPDSLTHPIYIYINSANIPPIMIINRIYENQNLLSL